MIDPHVPTRHATRDVQRVQYVGSYPQDYARHRIIQRGMRQLGVTVSELHDQCWLPARWWRLAAGLRATTLGTPVVVGEASNYLALVLLEARRLGLPLVFDPFISLRDTLDDRHGRLAQAALGPVMEIIDRVNNSLAQIVMLDTPQHRDFFVERLGLRPEKARIVPVGAETDLFVPRLTPPVGRVCTVLFYGTFIPLQGIDVILHAAARVQLRTRDIRLQIVGDGQTYRAMRQLAERLQLANTVFYPSVPYPCLPDLIAAADLCLGIFAARPKTLRVVPNKVYQSAAVGVPVITADTPAIRATFPADALALVPSGDPAALAETIMALADDTVRRQRIGAHGMHIVHTRYNPQTIAALVLEACQTL